MVLLLLTVGTVVVVVGLVIRRLAMAPAQPATARAESPDPAVPAMARPESLATAVPVMAPTEPRVADPTPPGPARRWLSRPAPDRASAAAVGLLLEELPGPVLEPEPAPAPPRPEALRHEEHQLTIESGERRRWARPTEDKVVLLVALTIYLVVAWLLAFHYESFNGDAQSRLANAYYVLFSRDPHLAAVGFVWNPLPSFSVMPLLLFKGIVPALATRAFAANIMSALFGALAVQQLVVTLRESGVRKRPRLALGALFALNPMILYYAASGMSEALFLLALIVAARYLSRWLDTGATGFLVAGGVALAFAYLARNEAAMAAASAGLVVFAVAASRADGPNRRQVLAGLSEGVVFLAPFVTVFVGWAAVSWLIVGHPFEQFSSQYGNSSQLKVLGDSVRVASPVRFVVTDVVALAPVLPVLVALAVLRIVRTRDLRPLAPLAVLGGVLAFAILGFLAGKTAPWWRYFISAVPLSILMAGSLLSSRARRPTACVRPGTRRSAAVSRWGSIGTTLAIFVATASTVPATAMSLDSPGIGREEMSQIGFILYDSRALTRIEQLQEGKYRRVVKMARFLDDLHLPNGSILVDTFSPCIPPMILASRHPAKFVITNDRDFQPVLADPVAFHAPYLLVPEAGTGYGSLDAINRAYPTLYATGAGFATLVRQLDLPGCASFRLYHIDDGSQPTFQQPAPGATR